MSDDYEAQALALRRQAAQSYRPADPARFGDAVRFLGKTFTFDEAAQARIKRGQADLRAALARVTD